MNRVSLSKKMNRSLYYAGLCLLLGAVSSNSLAQRIPLDRIIAMVDEDVVLQSELDARILDIRQSAARAGETLPDDEEFLTQVMEALVIENLQMQLADRVSIRFDDDTVNRILENMASNNNMSFDEYINVLNENDVYFETREQVRKQLTLQELQRGMVNRRITITEQEIQNFLNSEMGKDAVAATFFVDHMLIPSGASDSPEIKQAKLIYANDLVLRMREGENFIQVRGAASESRRYAIDATEFGWRKADELPGIFGDTVADMTEGDVEGPIAAGNGFHIIHLAGKRGGTEQLVNQTNLRHIMLSPNEIRNEEQTITEINKLYQRIADGEDFGSIARQNSDDASSVVAGGDLDWINEGGMPPEMEAVIDSLEIGTISEPFKSDTGWHIAEVIERRVEDLSDAYTSNQAENALRERKFDLELQNWLIEIREEAFVEFIE